MSFQFFFPCRVCWRLVPRWLIRGVGFMRFFCYCFNLSLLLFFLLSLSFPGGFLANKPAVCICFAHPANPSNTFQSLLMVCVKGLFGDQVSGTLLWGLFCTLPPNSILSGLRHFFHASISLSVGSCGTTKRHWFATEYHGGGFDYGMVNY